MVLYDQIGKGYNSTRKADPYLTTRFYEFMSAVPRGRYLDAGCGTGNYLGALRQKGLNLEGIDPSETMLEKARVQNPGVSFTCAKVEQLPFGAEAFEGATAILTLHHWDIIELGMNELYRVLKTGARLVCFSFTPEQVRGYWLRHYFPKMIERAANTIPTQGEMEALIRNAGFSTVYFEPYFVKPDLEDHFMYSCKHDPAMCLVPEMRKNTSGFTALANQAEVETGVRQLEQDIVTGMIDEVMKEYENEIGDYLFIVAEK